MVSFMSFCKLYFIVADIWDLSSHFVVEFVSSDRWHFVFLYEILTHPASTEQFLPQTRRFLAAAAPPICLLLRKLTCLQVQTVLRSNRYARSSPRHLPIVCLQEPASVSVWLLFVFL